MEIMLAKTAGFCPGVKRAVEAVYGNIGKEKMYTYGPIIHNKIVTGDLEEKGVKAISDLSEAEEGATIVIRSHGVPPEVYEEIEKRGFKYIDLTCGYVKKIHNIVRDNYNEGRSIIIVGSSVHPEVVGINGYSRNSAFIIEKPEDVKDLSLEPEGKYALVVQTTFNAGLFDEILKLLPEGIDIKIFNTICSATAARQKEAVEIAKKADWMIVLGDKNSSNTQKLFSISEKFCKNTFLFEKIYTKQLKCLKKNVKIGITAGASTPPGIIEEAIKTMSDENKTFEEMLNDTPLSLRSGKVVKGTVISVTDKGEVFVNLGFKYEGIIERSEFSDDVNVNPADVVKEGDEIEVYIKRVNDNDGIVELSKKYCDKSKTFDALKEAFDNNTVVTGKVLNVVKGGLMVNILGGRVFVPSSQVSNRFVEDLTKFVGQELDFNIIECTDKPKRRIVAGRRALVEKQIEERRQQLFDSLEVGSRVEGTVSRIVEFGAFVDLGGVDGLIHISEMSWGIVKKVSDILSRGDKVVVTILDINKEKGKISLSLKDINANPWNNAAEKYAVGNIVTGKVVRMVSFGAFVELEEGIDGLVHISQIAFKHVEKPEDELQIGQEITAKVTELDLENKKISLSIKAAIDKNAKSEEAAPAETTEE
ncbi:MAG: bifunctional 4-hydroxy-3-methylbut-2-enyl diphosphate reductase/30S ribosomal protein S1 [Clostridiales bacterium]|nr:bifunctional 4-hydroxy-3-methylbut-2-enyl diphosphate reductase/30S ribosomal protein S1 [Clostridiales bacterium]